MEKFFKINAYVKNDDKFPVNTWVGSIDKILDVSRNLMNNDLSGIARFEVIIDGYHPGWTVGQNPKEIT